MIRIYSERELREQFPDRENFFYGDCLAQLRRNRFIELLPHDTPSEINEALNVFAKMQNQYKVFL